MRFSVGVNYWPQRSGTAMWRRFDAGEVREDFTRIASLELDTVRVFVRWDEFAPEAASVDEAMLERLERLAGLASDAGLQLVPALFCGHMAGINWLPAWALDRSRPAGPCRTFTGERESPYGAGNVYAGSLLEAQLVLARAAGARLNAHPGLRAWDIGHAFSNVREPAAGTVKSGDHSTAPAAEPMVAEWGRRLAHALRESSGAGVTAGTFAGDVLEDRRIRLGSLCAPFAFASMQGSTVTSRFARSRLDPEAVPFLAMLAAAFSAKPVLVTGFGQPTCPPGKFSAFEYAPSPGDRDALAIAPDDTAFAPFACLTEAENAFVATAVLERLHADGRLGAYWWCWADYGDTFADIPPFDRAPHERTCGLIRSDGTEKPVAAALRDFAAQRRSVVRAVDMPMIASAYYYRTLPASTKTLYEAFLRFVEVRRA